MKRLLICGFIFLILCALLMVKCGHSVQEKRAKATSSRGRKVSKRAKKGDQYESFKQLIRHEKEGYEIEFHEKGGSDLLVFSPHGGN